MKDAKGHGSDQRGGGSGHDPALAHAIMDEARRSPDDFARDLHTVLPDRVKE
jgi:hypothetical protein